MRNLRAKWGTQGETSGVIEWCPDPCRCFTPRAVERWQLKVSVQKHEVVSAGSGRCFITSETISFSLHSPFYPGETTYSHFITTAPWAKAQKTR